MGRRLVVSRWEDDMTMSYDDVQWQAIRPRVNLVILSILFNLNQSGSPNLRLASSTMIWRDTRHLFALMLTIKFITDISYS